MTKSQNFNNSNERNNESDGASRFQGNQIRENHEISITQKREIMWNPSFWLSNVWKSHKIQEFKGDEPQDFMNLKERNKNSKEIGFEHATLNYKVKGFYIVLQP